MTTNNTDEKLFGFHFGKGCHVALWADSQKSAIDRFRKMMGTDLVFITDAEWKRRHLKDGVSIKGNDTLGDDRRENAPKKTLEAA